MEGGPLRGGVLLPLSFAAHGAFRLQHFCEGILGPSAPSARKAIQLLGFAMAPKKAQQKQGQVEATATYDSVNEVCSTRPYTPRPQPSPPPRPLSPHCTPSPSEPSPRHTTPTRQPPAPVRGSSSSLTLLALAVSLTLGRVVQQAFLKELVDDLQTVLGNPVFKNINKEAPLKIGEGGTAEPFDNKKAKEALSTTDSYNCGTCFFAHDILYSARMKIPVVQARVMDMAQKRFSSPKAFPGVLILTVESGMIGQLAKEAGWDTQAPPCPPRCTPLAVGSSWRRRRRLHRKLEVDHGR